MHFSEISFFKKILRSMDYKKKVLRVTQPESRLQLVINYVITVYVFIVVALVWLVTFFPWINWLVILKKSFKM